MNAVNLPKPRKQADYKAAQEGFLQLAGEYPDIAAVYSGGTMRHPGISDLDFVACVRDKLSGPLNIEEKLPTDVAELIGAGSILIVNEAAFPDIKIIDDFPLQHLQGRQFQFNEYSSMAFTLCRVLDWLPERLWSLCRFNMAAEQDVTRGLQLLQSLTVSLRNIQGLTKETAYDKFIQSVEDMRGEWFTRADSLEKFSGMIEEAQRVAARALDDIHQWLVRSGAVRVTVPEPQSLAFSIPRGPQFYFGDTVSFTGNTVTVPWSVAAYLQAQIKATDGFISRELSASFSTPMTLAFEIASELETTITARMEYVESLAAFFQENGIRRGLLKYGWFLYAPAKT